MTTWSCTPFFGELDVLEIRLATLDRVVDRHVLVEATVTQQGDPKPLEFEANRDRFARWLDRIAYVVVDDMPAGPDENWRREHFQRDACVRAMGGCADDDLVFLSDVDEIPDPAVFAVVDPSFGPMWVGMSMHLYFLDWRWLERPVMGGTRATVATGRMLRESLASALVESHSRYLEGAAGWHLAYQGGVDAIQRKLAALADFRDGPLAESWNPRWSSAEHLERCLATGADLFDRSERQSERVGLEELPPCVAADPGRWAHMLCGVSAVAA